MSFIRQILEYGDRNTIWDNCSTRDAATLPPTLLFHSQFLKDPRKSNYGYRKSDIIHHHLRNNVSNLKPNLHKDFLRDNSVIIKPKMFIIVSLNVHIMMLKYVLFLNVSQIWGCISL